MTPSKEAVYVTDHAVLRYMERAMGLNVEVVREHILVLCSGAAAFGATAVRAEGLRFLIDNYTVCTVAPDSAFPNKTSRELTQKRMRA